MAAEPSKLSATELLNLRKEIDELSSKPLNPGDIWYMIDVHWFNQWQKYTGVDADKQKTVAGLANMYPGPIDNAGILNRNSATSEYTLKPELIDQQNYVVLPEEAWLKLKNAFGVNPNQPELLRHVIACGTIVKQNKVEIYPLELHVHPFGNESAFAKIIIGKTKTIVDLVNEINRYYLNPETQKLRFIVKNSDGKEELFVGSGSDLLENSGLQSGQTIIFDAQNSNGSWNWVDREKASVSTSSAMQGLSLCDNRKPEAPGLCGLINLGNTCFMNSALQCMSNTPPLTNYLLSGRYESEINETNPLGMQGEMAKAYAELIKKLWDSKIVINPAILKTTVGRFAPQFSGYQQQDSQELLAFLLDGLHEDLNRVRQKPYIELKDNDGKSDLEAAAEAWANYKLRNDSIVTDLFHGLLKSTLVCPQCKKVSVKFDPFCYLSLPLPVKMKRDFHVTFVPLDALEQMMKYRITVPTNGIVRDLFEGLSSVICKPSNRFVLTEVYLNRFQKVFTGDELLSVILERDDLYAFEIDGISSEFGLANLCIYNSLYQKTPAMPFTVHNLIGMPMLAAIKKEQFNHDELYSVAKNAVSRFIDFPLTDDIWCLPDNDENSCYTDYASTYENVPPSASPNSKDQALFNMIITNCLCTADLQEIPPGNELLHSVNGDTYLCLVWDRLAENFFTSPEVKDHESVFITEKTSKKKLQLSHCLDLFTTTEKLGTDDLWFCPSCKIPQQATKTFDLWSVPEILIIHLKRFLNTGTHRDKIEDLVEFPLEGLDISKWIINERNTGILYDLIAVSNHLGVLGGGHYTAYAKNKITHRWYIFDDSNVSCIRESEVMTKGAYLLVYARRHIQALNIETDPKAEVKNIEV